ncbi:MAG: 3' terminal RNA ribose 2'-O-methyltransferase Hen1 [Deltaproteobacteria bacterium]|nr:3' terminal RNA ribose 2'-O-methyltransferase Hen1 [Deltaproteobacteria bacterium]
MLLTITTTMSPATDLGYLLHKNPSRVHTFELAFGVCHVFYPEASPHRCTAALLLDMDTVGMVRTGNRNSSSVYPYVNDRPYVASSFMSVAISRVFREALFGKSKHRQELADKKIPLEAVISVLPCRGGEGSLRSLFEPLGYEVVAEGFDLDDRFPNWGKGPYYRVGLKAVTRLKDMLSHINVLVPVMDNDKHYWVGDDEVDKLLRIGGEWLKDHPEREFIARRYLKNRRSLARTALARLLDEGDAGPEFSDARRRENEDVIEEKLSLNEERLERVADKLKASAAARVLDLGCGEGKLMKRLMAEKQFSTVTGLDVSVRSLEYARQRLRLDSLPEKMAGRVSLLHGSLIYRDSRIAGYDGAAVVEVIEHLDGGRLKAFERVLFEFARPKLVIVTTPNVEYNVKFENLAAGKFRHSDHRFEWRRDEFEAWARGVAERFGYVVEFSSVGDVDTLLGAPTQMGVFSLCA